MGGALDVDSPPAGWGPELRALWHAARGEWDAAHELVQDLATGEAAWVHACLHREEGDLGNAEYWYRRAGRPRSELDPAAEREAIAAELGA